MAGMVWAGVDIISGGGEATARVTVVMITPVYCSRAATIFTYIYTSTHTLDTQTTVDNIP